MSRFIKKSYCLTISYFNYFNFSVFFSPKIAMQWKSFKLQTLTPRLQMPFQLKAELHTHSQWRYSRNREKDEKLHLAQKNQLFTSLRSYVTVHYLLEGLSELITQKSTFFTINFRGERRQTPETPLCSPLTNLHQEMIFIYKQVTPLNI